MNTKNRHSLQDALKIITGDDSEFDGCEDSSDEDPEDPNYTPSNKDMESDESSGSDDLDSSESKDLDNLLQQEIYFVGTLRSNRLAGCQLDDEKDLAKRGRVSFDVRVEREESIAIVKWYDNKSVTLISSYCATEPQDKVQRWSKSGKACMKEYNTWGE
ncbi:hypothetical protein MHYP_G00357440 [Metynnis hypsauchen]